MRSSVLIASESIANELISRLSDAGDFIGRIETCRPADIPGRVRRGPRPDVLILDGRSTASVREIGGVARYVGRFWAGTRTLVVGDESVELLVAARGGADGYVLREATPQELVDAISGRTRPSGFYIPRCFCRAVPAAPAWAPVTEHALSTSDLTPRESEMLPLIAQGRSNRELAGHFEISMETARWHAKNVLHKLGLHTRVELVSRWSRERGIAAPSGSFLAHC